MLKVDEWALMTSEKLYQLLESVSANEQAVYQHPTSQSSSFDGAKANFVQHKPKKENKDKEKSKDTKDSQICFGFQKTLVLAETNAVSSIRPHNLNKNKVIFLLLLLLPLHTHLRRNPNVDAVVVTTTRSTAKFQRFVLCVEEANTWKVYADLANLVLIMEWLRVQLLVLTQSL